MKVVDLGHGALAIEPETPADSVKELTTARLKHSQVSEEAIRIYQRYLDRTSSSVIKK
jgi:hypothetical protein